MQKLICYIWSYKMSTISGEFSKTIGEQSGNAKSHLDSVSVLPSNTGPLCLNRQASWGFFTRSDKPSTRDGHSQIKSQKEPTWTQETSDR